MKWILNPDITLTSQFGSDTSLFFCCLRSSQSEQWNSWWYRITLSSHTLKERLLWNRWLLCFAWLCSRSTLCSSFWLLTVSREEERMKTDTSSSKRTKVKNWECLESATWVLTSTPTNSPLSLLLLNPLSSGMFSRTMKEFTDSLPWLFGKLLTLQEDWVASLVNTKEIPD